MLPKVFSTFSRLPPRPSLTLAEGSSARGQLGVQVLSGLQLGVDLFRNLGVEDIYKEIPQTQQREVEDSRKDVLRLLQI